MVRDVNGGLLETERVDGMAVDSLRDHQCLWFNVWNHKCARAIKLRIFTDSARDCYSTLARCLHQIEHYDRFMHALTLLSCYCDKFLRVLTQLPNGDLRHVTSVVCSLEDQTASWAIKLKQW
jgi:hypothetical protein